MLKSNAVPSIFPNLPFYLSKPEIPERRDPNVRRSEQLKRHESAVETFVKSDTITNFECLIQNFKSKLNNILEKVHFLITNKESLTFYTLDIDGIPKIRASVKINNELVVRYKLL